jgi:hypothetical protein
MKQKLFYLFKLLVGIILVVWILQQVDQQDFTEYFRHIGIIEMAIVCVLAVLSLIIQYERWKYLVENYSAEFEEKDIFPSFLAGFTLRLMIPGGHAEWSKAFLMSGRKRGKVLAVGMEKVLQTMFKVILIGAVLPFSFPGYTVPGILIIITSVTLYYLLPRFVLVQNLMEREVNTHRLFFISSLQSTGILILSAGQYFILLRQDYLLSFLDSLHATIYLWAAGIFPLSISGLGIREGLAIYFFRKAGVVSADAVATSLFLFAINAIIPALVGIYYLYRNRENLKTLRQTIRSSKELLGSLLKNKKDT